jgi:hypothetical protein
MVRIRRIAAIAALVAIGAAYGAAAPAHADVKSEAFGAISEGTGLDIKVLNTGLTLGHAKSAIDGSLGTANKTVKALAEGAGQLLTSSVVSTVAPTATGLLTDVGAQKCVANIPILTILNVSAACGASSSSVVSDAPLADATGYVADIRVPANGLVGQILNSLGIGDLGATLSGLLGGGVGSESTTNGATDQALGLNLLNGLPVLSSLGGVQSLTNAVPVVGGVLNDLLDLLNQGVSLDSLVPDPVVIQVGTSKSLIKTELNTVTSEAIGRGIEIKVLPVTQIPALADGIVHIIIGDAHTTASYDRVTGKSDAQALAANLLKVDVLGVSLPIAPNLDLHLLDNTPLATSVVLGHGTTSINADQASAEATGAAVSLLNGDIKLTIAHAASQAGGSFKNLTNPPVVAAVEATRELPRTGGPGPWVPMAAVVILVAAGATRRAVVRTR